MRIATRGNLFRGITSTHSVFDTTIRWVATTGEGYIINSVDGINWSYPTTNKLLIGGASGSAFGDVIYANGVWLVTRSQTTYLMSTDGNNWTQYTYANGRFSSATSYAMSTWATDGTNIAIVLFSVAGTGAGNIYYHYTTDGINWNENNGGTTGSTIFNNRLAYGGGTWVLPQDQHAPAGAVGYFLTTSPDIGVTRSTVSNGVVSRVASPTYINGAWLVSTRNGTYQLFGDLASTPTAITNPGTMGAAYMIGRMQPFKGTFYTYPEAQATSSVAWNQIYSTTDGTNWNVNSTNIPVLSAATPSIIGYASYRSDGSSNRIANAANNKAVCFGARFSGSTTYSGSSTAAGIVYSTDGNNWNRTTITGLDNPGNFPNIMGIAARPTT